MEKKEKGTYSKADLFSESLQPDDPQFPHLENLANNAYLFKGAIKRKEFT